MPSVRAAMREPGSELSNAARVVVAEDDPEMRRLIVSVLEREGYAVTPAIDGRALLLRIVATEDRASDPAVDLIVSDLRMPAANGLDILRALRRAGRETPFILLSAFGDRATRVSAELLGATFLAKPFAMRDLCAAVRKLLVR